MPSRKLRPSSRQEHVNASSNHNLFRKACTAQLLSINLRSLLAWRQKRKPGKFFVKVVKSAHFVSKFFMVREQLIKPTWDALWRWLSF